MQDLARRLKNYAGKDLDERKNWYTSVAAAYNQARPGYPAALIQQVVAIAQISTATKILEIETPAWRGFRSHRS